MLVLSRKTDESISIADGLIVVTVCRLTSGGVRIGIDAPRGINVARTEVQRPVDPAEIDRVKNILLSIGAP